jgi:hypothetical protein
VEVVLMVAVVLAAAPHVEGAFGWFDILRIFLAVAVGNAMGTVLGDLVVTRRRRKAAIALGQVPDAELAAVVVAHLAAKGHDISSVEVQTDVRGVDRG